MKRFFSLISAIFFSMIFAAAHAENLQIVMPKIIYIGDTVEVRYIFHSETNLFGGDFENPSARLSLKTNYDIFGANDSAFTLKSASLEKLNSEYTLSLTIFPWKTGFCVIPPFNLTSLVYFSQTGEFSRSGIPFIVKLSPIEVKSLVQKTGKHSFLPQASPLALPGTTAFLAVLGIFSIIIFAILLFALLHLPKIARFIENISYLYSLKRNSRKTIRKLLALQKESHKISSDKDFAAEVQHIIRAFLKKRFATDFSSVTTTKFYQLFTELLGGELSENQSDAVENLTSHFSWLDYVRFAGNAGFLNENENDGTSGRVEIIQKSIDLVEKFDTEEDSPSE